MAPNSNTALPTPSTLPTYWQRVCSLVQGVHTNTRCNAHRLHRSDTPCTCNSQASDSDEMDITPPSPPATTPDTDAMDIVPSSPPSHSSIPSTPQSSSSSRASTQTLRSSPPPFHASPPPSDSTTDVQRALNHILIDHVHEMDAVRAEIVDFLRINGRIVDGDLQGRGIARMAIYAM